jgi:DNA polymerase-3 subunit delta'
LYQAGTHADFLRLEPPEEGKSIGIDAIREALRFLSATASLGQQKVLEVTPAEKMTQAAFNAFLKGLEEPPARTTIVLVTARGFPIPATIRSRCQRWSLESPDADETLAWVLAQASVNGLDVAEPLARKVCSLVPGQPLRALELLESKDGEALVELLELLGGSAGASGIDPLRLRALISQRAGQIDITAFLSLAELFIDHLLRDYSAPQLRSPSAHAAFKGLHDIAAQRAAINAGTNPNPDLLRHRTTEHLLDALVYPA